MGFSLWWVGKVRLCCGRARATNLAHGVQQVLDGRAVPHVDNNGLVFQAQGKIGRLHAAAQRARPGEGGKGQRRVVGRARATAGAAPPHSAADETSGVAGWVIACGWAAPSA